LKKLITCKNDQIKVERAGWFFSFYEIGKQSGAGFERVGIPLNGTA